MSTAVGTSVSLAASVTPKGAQAPALGFTSQPAPTYTMTTASAPTSWMDMGVRGKTWQECSIWFESMPGSMFQVFGTCLFLAFMGSGHNKVAAVYTHVLSSFAFLALAIWAILDICALDVICWSLVLVAANVMQIVYINVSSAKMKEVFTPEMQDIYNHFFAPFEITPEVFAELVACKGCQVLKLTKGHNYAAEGKTPIEKLSMLISGKVRVVRGTKVLHYVGRNDFLDSPEWESLKSAGSTKRTYEVTITAETDCTYIAWKRKPLQTLLAKRKRLGKIFNYMIGRDVVNKLYLLNTNQFNNLGYRYDIRLPMIMSLREDVMEREKRKKEISGADTPTGKRHKRLGKNAEEHYKNMFTRRMSAKLEMMKTSKDRRPSADAKRQQLVTKD